MTQFLRSHVYVVLILALSLFAWAPLLIPAYFFQAHDAPHSVFFLVEFDQSFQDGYLWPRWAPDFAFGYGYPLFNLYAPLAFYAAEIFHLLGLGFVASVKTVYVLATMGAGLAMYGFVRRIMGREAGFLAAVVYMFVPFHLLEIYVRSAYSEFVALALLPLVLWAFTALVLTPSRSRVAWAALAYGLLALTHHTSFFTFTPFLLIYVLFLLLLSWLRSGQRSFGKLLSRALLALTAGVLGLMLAAIYLVPLLAETRYIKVSQWTAFNYDFSQHFVFLGQLLSPYWGYGYSGPGLEDGMPFQLGAVPLVLAMFGAWLALTGWRKSTPANENNPARPISLFFLLATIVLVWLILPSSHTLWQILPIASLVQFPWRLLGLTAISLAVLAGSLYPAIPRPMPDPTRQEFPGRPVAELMVLALVVVLGSFAYTLPHYTDVEDWRESPEAVIRWDSFSPPDRVAMVIYTEEQPVTGPMEAQYLNGEPLQVAAIIDGQGDLKTVRHGGSSDEIQVNASGPVRVQFYTYDYPGWQMRVDGQPTAHQNLPPHGLITADIEAGEHQIELRMGSTPARTAGSLVSLLSLICIGALFVSGRSRSRQIDSTQAPGPKRQ